MLGPAVPGPVSCQSVNDACCSNARSRSPLWAEAHSRLQGRKLGGVGVTGPDSVIRRVTLSESLSCLLRVEGTVYETYVQKALNGVITWFESWLQPVSCVTLGNILNLSVLLFPHL